MKKKFQNKKNETLNIEQLNKIAGGLASENINVLKKMDYGIDIHKERKERFKDLINSSNNLFKEK